MALNSIGISIRDTTGQLNPLSTTLQALGEKWGSLDSVQKSNIGYYVAGTRQLSILDAVMNSYTRSTELSNVAQNSSGNLMEQNAKYADSFAGRVNTLKATWQGFSTQLLSNDTLKSGVSGLNDLLNGIIKLVNTFGLLPIVIGVVSSAFLILNKSFDVNSISKYANAILSLPQAYEEAKAEGLGLSAALNAVGIEFDFAKIQAIAFQAAISLGLAAGITLLISGITSLITNITEANQKQQEMLQTSADSAKKYEDETKSISGLVEQYGKLSASGKTDEATKSQLLDIQKQLITSYGNEAKGLDLVNGKYDDQIKKLQELNKAKADDYLRSNQENINNAQNTLSKTDTTTLSHNSNGSNRIQSIMENTNGVNFNQDGAFNEYDITGNLEKRVEVLKQILDKSESITNKTSQEQKTINDVSNEYGKLNGQLTNAQTTIEKMYSAQLNSKYSSQMTQMTADLSKYQQAMSSGDKGTIEKTSNDFVKLQDSMDKTLSKSPELKKAFDDWVSGLNSTDKAIQDNSNALQSNNQFVVASDDQQKEWQKSLTDSTDKIKDYSKYIKDMNANTGHISSADVKDITKNHAELIPYLSDEKVLYQEIQKEIDNEKTTAQNAYAQMMENSEEYYNANIKGTNTITDALRKYGVDITTEMQNELDNSKSLAEAKWQVEKKLIDSLSQAWSDYYKVVGDAESKIISNDDMTPWKISGDLDSVMNNPQAKALREKAQSLQGTYNSIENAFNDVTANFKNSNVIDEMSDASEGLDKTSSADSAAKKANEQAIKDLEGQVKDLERQKKAYDDSVETAYKAEQQQEDAIKKGYQDQLDALQKKNDLQNQNNELLKNQNDLIEKQQDLENAQNEKNVRIYENGQWVWSADQQKVDSAQKALTEAQQTLSTKQNEIAEKAQEDALNALITASEARKSAYETNYQNTKDATDKNYDNQIDSLNQQKETLQGYASGTDNADSGIKQVAENGVELIVGSQLRNFNGGETVLNNDNTSKLFSILNGNGLSSILNNSNLGFKMPNISIPNFDFSKLKSSSSTTNNTPITIQKIELPSVNNAQGFINELTQLVHTSM